MSNDQREDLYKAGMLPKLSHGKHMDAVEMLKQDLKMIEETTRIREVQLGAASNIDALPSRQKLQSRHKIGDTVTITAKVAGIQFSDSKVRYVFDLGETLSIVDSEHVEPAQPVGKD